MSKDFTFIDHTADIGLLCKGETKEALFEAAAEGMFSIITDLETITVLEWHEVETNASAYDDLLIHWLQELLFIFATRHYIYSEFSTRILHKNDDTLSIHGKCGGEPVDHDKHRIFTEIKTATYHQLYVKQTPGSQSWEGKVIFDL